MTTEQRRALAKTIPTTEVIRDAVTFPRDRLGEPLDIDGARFDAWLARVRRDAKAEAILMDGFDMAVADRLADAGYTEYAEDEDGGATWVSAPLGEVLHIVRICATEYETGDRA